MDPFPASCGACKDPNNLSYRMDMKHNYRSTSPFSKHQLSQEPQSEPRTNLTYKTIGADFSSLLRHGREKEEIVQTSSVLLLLVLNDIHGVTGRICLVSNDLEYLCLHSPLCISKGTAYYPRTPNLFSSRVHYF